MKKPEGISKYAFENSEEARKLIIPHPCGNCFPCKLQKSREWKHRICLEATTHSETTFVTLTYSDETIPRDWSLDKRDLQLFLKKLRKKLTPLKIRYFAVGEYGDKSSRPHYHLIVFNMPPDNNLICSTWNNGLTQSLEMLDGAAGYITGYCVKKLTSSDDPRLNGRKPEFMTCSKKDGGIGSPAINNMAKEIKKDQYFELRTIRELDYGKNSHMPLGKYLTKKLQDAIGVPEIIRQLESYCNAKELHEAYSVDDNEYQLHMVEDFKNKRLSQRKKYEIHKQKRVI